MFFFRRSLTKAIILILALATIISLRYNGSFNRVLTTDTVSRELSINLGNGQCEWTPAIFDVPTDETFFKTLIAGYPSGDKRLTFVQMEALTGLSARDEWDFKVGAGPSETNGLDEQSYHHLETLTKITFNAML